MVLAIVAILLGLAVIIAVLGIVNTLALSVVERTRELGLLRAVGMSRRQLRSMIRWESVNIALIGGVLGVAVGMQIGVTISNSLGDVITSVTFPWARLGMFVVFAVLAGVAAAVVPARRAARLDVATFCRVCEPACGLVATVDDGAIVDVRADDEHPVSKGFACAKGIAALDIHRDPDRLNHPHAPRRRPLGARRRGTTRSAVSPPRCAR